MKRCCLAISALLFFAFGNAQTTVISYNSTWKYLDNGTNQGTAWSTVAFNDAAWASGAAQLGYGDGDEATVVSFGPNSKKKYFTTYFRKVVSITNPSGYANFTLSLKRDDGAVVYVNGTEAFRSNMPTGAISYTTKASSTAADDGNTAQTVTLAKTLFLNGSNTVAVEIHQFNNNASDDDISFDLQLVANPAANIPPVANAGNDQTITLPTNSVTLNGSGSSDADGTITTYAWTKVSGGAATITTPGAVSTTVTGLTAGTYTFRLTVTDNATATATDDIVVTVNPAPNTPPVANAGNDQTITLPTNSVTLNGSGSSDADGTITTYSWTKISGGAATITSPGAVSTTVTGLTQGSYTFRLTVTDNGPATATDDVVITVNPAPNTPPVANAGNDQTITLPTNSVTLNGSGSSDADGTITSYAWTKVSGGAATITTPGAVSTTVTGLTQGSYTFRLTVTDNGTATAIDDVVITVNPAPNTPPVANAGNDQTITLPTNSVTLNGSGSSDADGTITSYAWTKVSGGAATITTPGAVSTTVTGLTQGSYTFRLTVTDNGTATATDDVVITVNPAPNTPPVANAGNDQTITLPINSVTLNGSSSSDADGTITSYAWTKVSGGAATITTPGAVSTTVTGLTQGSYTFRLTVTDNGTATATDDVVVTVNPAITTYNVVSYGGTWKYLDNGTDQGTAWRASGFADGAWASGPGQLGFGDGDEATVVSYGPDANNKYTTTYFRKTVSISSPASYTNFSLGVKRDDGIVMYVNGVEVYRNNMPTGTITSATLASAAASDDGNTIQTATIASSFFANGNNTIAVEMHQNAGTSTDLSFDMELIANAPGSVTITRGPYLQMVNGTAATLRWRTSAATDTKLSVGTTFGTYPLTTSDATQTTEHEIRITGLTADTKYFYSFGSTTQTLQSATSNYFTTAPPANTTRKLRIAAYGDCGINTNGFQAGTLTAYQNYVGSSPAELMLLLGDNAYNAGTDAEYTSGFFNVYSGNILKNHVLFPAPGNHDYANTSARQTDHNIPYYSIFTMPSAAQCGGVASNTEAFYSYNWGNIHFLSLDSYGFETGSTRLYDTLGPQVTWIKNDLNANSSKWVIAYWHHPPYTMGSHNSDNESDLVAMRNNFIRILERYGVDMILCGHSHDYERSYLLKGHFGNEASFSVGTHAVSGSSAKYNGTANSCPYNTASGKVNHGTVYVVAGSAGADGGVQTGYPHNALPFSVDDGGMLYFEVEDNRLDAKFIRRDNTIADQFTILKDAAKTTTVNITSGQQTTLTASWIGNYSWSTGAATRSIVVSPAATTSYTCTDGGTVCLTDNFTVNVSSPLIASAAITGKNATANAAGFNAYPTPVKRGAMITIAGKENTSFEVMIVNERGQQVKQLKIRGSVRVGTSDMPAGIYFVRNKNGKKNDVKKIIITD